VLVLAVGTWLLVVVGLHGRPDPHERSLVTLTIAAAVAVAALAGPVRRRAADAANQWVYGELTAPEEVIRTFSSRMSRSLPMDELLLQLAESLRRSMDLSAAEVWIGSEGTWERHASVPHAGAAHLRTQGDEIGVAARARVVGNGWLQVWLPDLLGERGDRQLRLAPMSHLGEHLGFLLVERTADAPAFGEDEERLLVDVSRQVGLALHNVRLDSALQASLEELRLRNLELQASRARIVAAADESRRRIERDLHDGAQQQLVAMAVKLGLAPTLAGDDPDAAKALFAELRSDVQEAVTTLRELAHGIYPPLLRDRGLDEALRAAAGRSSLRVTVDATTVGRVDGDVEAAVYFCCLEAMQNAQKHAGDGASVEVCVALDGASVRFEVSDDGAGFEPASTPRGHGFQNIADRLGAFGGSVEVASAPGKGTTLTGTVPLPAPRA
jgi:signal transduction histidine kinase